MFLFDVAGPEDFFESSGMGWLIPVLIILVIALVAYFIYRNKAKR